MSKDQPDQRAQSQQNAEEKAAIARDYICSGGEGVLGHPRVYLAPDAETGTATCPYCSRSFPEGKCY